MSNLTPTFITMADQRFYESLLISARQISIHYPDSQLYLYDVGLTDDQRQKLAAVGSHVRILPWQLQFLPVHISYDRRFVLTKICSLISDYITSLFRTHDWPSLRTLIRQNTFEILIQNKLAIIKHHNDSVQTPFIFLDADAFVIDQINELFDGSFDIGVTLRRFHEHSYARNRCRLLNVGVLLFLGDYQTNKALIDHWQTTARTTTELCSEQTSLTRLLLAHNPDIFTTTGHTATITLPHPVRIRILDCDTYNFTHLEEIQEPTDLVGKKILHFKNDRFKTPQFQKINRWLN